jgi:hypothetical protein
MDDFNNNINILPVSDFFNEFCIIPPDSIKYAKTENTPENIQYNKESKKVIELKVTMEMLWNSFKDERCKPLYYLLRSLMLIILDFIDDINIRNIYVNYIKLLDYSEYLTKEESLKDDFYYVFCARFFTGKINKFFSGKYGDTIPDEYWVNNKEFIDVYSNYIDTIKTPYETDYRKKYKDAMKTLKSHLGLVYTSKKFEEHIFKTIEEKIYNGQFNNNELKRKRDDELNI